MTKANQNRRVRVLNNSLWWRIVILSSWSDIRVSPHSADTQIWTSAVVEWWRATSSLLSPHSRNQKPFINPHKTASAYLEWPFTWKLLLWPSSAVRADVMGGQRDQIQICCRATADLQQTYNLGKKRHRVNQAEPTRLLPLYDFILFLQTRVWFFLSQPTDLSSAHISVNPV